MLLIYFLISFFWRDHTIDVSVSEIGKNAKIQAVDVTSNDWPKPIVDGTEYTDLAVDGTDLDIRGLAINSSVIYIADDASNKIYKASIPGAANTPLGLTRDSSGNFYILMNNSPNDSIMKVDSSGDKVTAWATDGVADTSSSATNSMKLTTCRARPYKRGGANATPKNEHQKTNLVPTI